MNAQEAADRYTGCSDRVNQDDLEEALGYFEYAVAAYYVVVSAAAITQGVLVCWSAAVTSGTEFVINVGGPYLHKQ